MASISEMDNQIAHFESQSPKNKRGEVKLMRLEKEKYVTLLKELVSNFIQLLNNSAD